MDRFSVFQFQKSETDGGDVSISGFERLDRLSLPQRARRCADDAVITLRLVLQLRADAAPAAVKPHNCDVGNSLGLISMLDAACAGETQVRGLSMRRIFLLGGMLAALVAAGATTVALKLTKPVIAQQHAEAAVPDPAILNKHLRDMREEMTLP